MGSSRRSVNRSLAFCERRALGLLDRAADLREHVVGVRTDEADRTHDDYQNHGQHNCVFCDVLTTLIVPKLLKTFCHWVPHFHLPNLALVPKGYGRTYPLYCV